MIFGLQQFLSINAEKVLVSIDRIVKEIDEKSSCDISNWAHKLDNACKCCLIQEMPKLNKGKSAEDIINDCSNKGYCIEPLLEAIKQGSLNAQEALKKLYNTSVIIKTVDTHGINLNQRGHFTETGLKNFLEKAYKEGKLPNEDFKSVTCLKVEDTCSRLAGCYTEQLFFIYSNCSTEPRTYILKETKVGYKEIYDLARFIEIKEIDDLVWPNRIKGYASVAIPIAYLRYDNHFLVLMPRAPGKMLFNFISNYFSHQITREKINQMFFDVGYALAKFHQRFMKKESNRVLNSTLVHSDFHFRNVLYDENSGQVVMVDTASMPASFKNPKPVAEDIGYFLLTSAYTYGVSIDTWLELATEPFLKGYISAYPFKDQQAALNELIQDIKSYEWHGRPTTYKNYRQVLDNAFNKLKQYFQTRKEPTYDESLSGTLTKLITSLENLYKLL